MTSYDEEQADRDKDLGNRVSYYSEDLATRLQTWIQQEVGALKDRVRELAESEAAPDWERRARVRALKDLEEIDAYELNDVMVSILARIKQARDGTYDNLLDDYHDLQDALHGLERMARVVLRIRQMMETNWVVEEPDDEAGDSDDDHRAGVIV